MADDDPLQDLIEAVADGTLDRRRLPATHQDPTISQLLAELQVLAGVADVHRSQVASDEEATTDGVGGADPALTRPAAAGGHTGHPRGPAGAAASDHWGNFELIKKVGEGTFGEVFLARDLWLGHDVALKLLKANIVDRARMLQEARMLVRVRHLNVVMVHGADVHEGRLGFWMDFIEGSTLDEAIHREGPRSAGEALAWGQDLCRALAAVHNAGIVHRDVKAQNVMRRTSDGRLVLMDFGAGELLGTPRGGPGAGTPLYLAPELVNGAEASRSSDIYALGVLLFFLVSRKFPVRANTWDELVAAHARHDRVRLEDVRPDIPPAFVDVIERALRPEPSQRYASAGEMLAAMRAGDESGPLTLTTRPRLPVVQPPAPPSRLRQRLVQLASLVVGVFGFILVLGYVACEAFDSVLAVDPAFAAGLSDFLTVGRQAAFPFLVYWLAAAAILLALDSARQALPTGWVNRFRHWGPRWALTDPLPVGLAICLAGSVGAVAINYEFYPVFAALSELRTGTISAMSASALRAGGANTTHGELSAILSFALGFAVWKVFPALERRATAPSALRALRAATLVVAVLTVVLAVIPRRVVWDRFELVEYENQQAFVLGARGDELLLYVPSSRPQPWRRVSATSARIERTGARRELFSPS